MKVDASPPPPPAPVAAPAANPTAAGPAASAKAVPAAIAEAPLPVIDASKAPSVAARLEGNAERNLRATLAQLKEDVSPKSLALAVNKLATHVRQDVHQTLKAMLGGDVDAVKNFMKTDHFDFARAELKAIAAKLPPRVVDTTERVVDLQMGVVAGMTPLPAAPLYDHAFEYELGQRMGAAVGLAGDAVAIVMGSGMTGGGAASVLVTGPLGVGVSDAGLALAVTGTAGAAFHGARWAHPLPPPVYEARAAARGERPTKLNEDHIFRGEVKNGIEKLSKEIKAERARLNEVKKLRQLTAEELKVFEKKKIRVAGGFHLESAGGENARVIESTRTPPDANGVYRANVEIRDPTTGEWVRKDAKSTFFPATYSEEDVRKAIAGVYRKLEPFDGAWRGEHDSLDLLVVVDEGDVVQSAYPLMEIPQ